MRSFERGGLKGAYARNNIDFSLKVVAWMLIAEGGVNEALHKDFKQPILF